MHFLNEISQAQQTQQEIKKTIVTNLQLNEHARILYNTCNMYSSNMFSSTSKDFQQNLKPIILATFCNNYTNPNPISKIYVSGVAKMFK